MTALRQLTRGKYTTGWYGIPGGPWWRSTLVHAKLVGQRHPVCGSRVSEQQAWQWCAHGIVEEYIDCGKCKRSIETIRAYLVSRLERGE